MTHAELDTLRDKVVNKLREDANPEIWWYVGEAINRVNLVFDQYKANLGPDF